MDGPPGPTAPLPLKIVLPRVRHLPRPATGFDQSSTRAENSTGQSRHVHRARNRDEDQPVRGWSDIVQVTARP